MPKELSALFYPQIVCLDEEVLKYLLLVYDKLYYLPNDIHLNPEHTRISSRFSVNDSILFGAFGTQRDAHYALMYSSNAAAWDDVMKRLMGAYDFLEDRGVCVPLQEPAFASPYQAHPLQSAVDSDLQDREFLSYCDRYQNPKVLVPDQPKSSVFKVDGLMMRPPVYQRERYFSALCSERINSALYFAGLHDLVPVSNHDLYIRLFNLKLKRALANPSFRPADGSSERKRKARFSVLSWQLLAETVPPEALARRSVEDVLKYKEKSAEPAARFRAYLFELEAGLSSAPWDDALREEVSKVVRTKVIPELEKLREAKVRIWEQLFHEGLKTVFSHAQLKTLVPLLTMYLLPGVSYLELICLSTATLTGGVFPKLLDARSQESQRRRNALFFVLGLAR
jgi:hypothetical protein